MGERRRQLKRMRPRIARQVERALLRDEPVMGVDMAVEGPELATAWWVLTTAGRWEAIWPVWPTAISALSAKKS